MPRSRFADKSAEWEKGYDAGYRAAALDVTDDILEAIEDMDGYCDYETLDMVKKAVRSAARMEGR